MGLAQGHNAVKAAKPVGGGGGGGALGVILVRVCELEFESYPSHILRLRKNDLFIYLIE